MDNKSAD
jgi:3-oxoacyl-[acyl-carrier protein] reductase